MTAVLEARTYQPADDVDLDPVDRLLSGRSDAEFALVGPDGTVAIPAEVHAVLVQVVGAMRAGRSITLTPHARRLTTQQAADMLGISRPTLVKLVEAGEIPCERVSSRRTLLLEDVNAYRRARRDRQMAAIAATAADLDDDVDEREIARLLREARRARAEHRRARSR